MFLLLLVSISLHLSNGWYYEYAVENDTSQVESTYVTNEIDSDNLELTGTKKVTISAGSDGNIDISQDLNLSIGGRIGKYGKLEGVVNDNGSGGEDFISKNLSGYNEIYLSYSFKNFSSKFGRINFWIPELGFNTPLLGGMVSYGAAAPRPPHKLTISLTYGEIPGKFVKKTFTNIKNTNYPIKLVTTGEYIVEETDHIFLNNLPLKRGKDYTIDYSTGVLYILPGVKIEPDDVLRAQFFVQSSPGRRNLGVAKISYNTGDVSAKVIFKQAEDDIAYWRDQLGDEAFDSLKSSVDTGLVKIPAWKFVGSGNGDYDRIDSIFIFKGKNKGSYIVRFSPLNGGDYQFSDTGNFYFFVGKGNGKYTPYFFTRLPSRSRNLYVNLNAEKGNLSFGSLMNVRENAPNLFNTGSIRRDVSGKWAVSFHNNLLSLELSYFKEVDSLGMVLNRNIKGNGYYIKSSFRPNAYFEPAFFYTNGDSGFVRRIWVRGGKGIFYSLGQTVSDTYRVYSLMLGYRTDKLNFSNRFRRYIASSSGFLEYSSNIRFRELLSAGIIRRFFDNGEMDNILSMGIETGNLSFRYELTSVSSNGQDSLFQSVYANAEGIKGDWSYSARILYRSDRSSEYIYRFIFVGRGNGSFSYDSTTGNFYQDPLGDYEKELVEVSGQTAVKNFNGSASLGIGSFFIHASADTRFKDLKNPLHYRYSAYFQGNPGKFYFTIGAWVYKWSEINGESAVDMEAELRGKITRGISAERKMISDWSRVELRKLRFYERFGYAQDASLTLSLFYKSVKWSEVATTPGVELGTSVWKSFHGFSFRGDLSLSISKKIPDAPEILESGFSASYLARLSRQLGQRTLTEMELRGRYSGGHHVYSLKGSISFNF